MSEIGVSLEAINYNYGPVLTPYQSLENNFDRPIGLLREKATFWRLGTFISLLASGAVMIGLIFILNTPQNTVSAVEFSGGGFVRSVANLTDEYDIPLNVSAEFIKTYISAFFSPNGIENLEAKNTAFIKNFSSASVTENYLNLLEQKEDNGISTPIEVTEVRWVGPNTYEAKWRRVLQKIGLEKNTASEDGSSISSAFRKDPVLAENIKKATEDQNLVEYETYTGRFVVRFVTPGDEEWVLANPLGFYIDQMVWKKESKEHAHSHLTLENFSSNTNPDKN